MNKDLGLIGRYELQRPLGRGSLAEVWKAFDTRLKRSVALKLLHSDLQVDPNFITRFEREMPVISSLGHANIKPSNILLDKQYLLRNPMGEPKLTDFGIAKMFATNTGKFNTQFSTPLYIAPEQALHYPAGNELSDIYTLGVILYEICTGKLPFEGESASDI